MLESKESLVADHADQKRLKWEPSWLSEMRLEAVASQPATTAVAISTSESSSHAPATSLATAGPLPWRSEIAGWPLPWREQWGQRTAALEATGLGWRESERRAYEEMTAEEEGS